MTSLAALYCKFSKRDNCVWLRLLQYSLAALYCKFSKGAGVGSHRDSRCYKELPELMRNRSRSRFKSKVKFHAKKSRIRGSRLRIPTVGRKKEARARDERTVLGGHMQRSTSKDRYSPRRDGHDRGYDHDSS